MFDLVLKHVPPAKTEPGPFRMLGTLLEANPFLGRIITGRIASGTVKPNQSIKVLDREGKVVETGRVSKILAFRGLERAPIDVGEAGDIVSIAGLMKGTVADTFCDPAVNEPIQAQPIDPPTVTMSFIVNDSPLAGTEGDKVTSRMIRDRLFKEAEGNVTLKIEEAADKDSFYVSGRGELQLAILIETMRREGFEIAVSRPRVVFEKDEDGNLLEPVEEVVVDVDEEHSGVVVQKMSERKAEMIEMRPSGGDRLRLVFHAPTRGLIGYQGELMTDTRGTAIMNRLFKAYEPFKGEIPGRRNGVLISNDKGEAVAYAMWNLEDRGPMMIEPGAKVYQGMIVGEHNRENDLEVNVLKGKKLTNIRTTRRTRRSPDPADPHDPRKVARLDPGRRADGSHAEVDPPAQDGSRPERSQARRALQGSLRLNESPEGRTLRAFSCQLLPGSVSLFGPWGPSPGLPSVFSFGSFTASGAMFSGRFLGFSPSLIAVPPLRAGMAPGDLLAGIGPRDAFWSEWPFDDRRWPAGEAPAAPPLRSRFRSVSSFPPLPMPVMAACCGV